MILEISTFLKNCFIPSNISVKCILNLFIIVIYPKWYFFKTVWQPIFSPYEAAHNIEICIIKVNFASCSLKAGFSFLLSMLAIVLLTLSSNKITVSSVVSQSACDWLHLNQVLPHGHRQLTDVSLLYLHDCGLWFPPSVFLESSSLPLFSSLETTIFLFLF